MKKLIRGPFLIFFFITGLLATLWFLIRVIPKPSRAGYPCMRAAGPFMSAFILYLFSLSASFVAFRRSGKMFRAARYAAASFFIVMGCAFTFFSGTLKNTAANASPVTGSGFAANMPTGTGKGIHPGRVVWVWNKNATDINCTNTAGDYWFMNTDAAQVDSMLEHGIMELAGIPDIENAWDTIFRYFNIAHGKGNTGYTPGEKICIKINLTNSCCSVTETTKISDFERMDATPELCLALLRQLVDVIGVAETDIYLGDPFRTFHDLYWDMCHPVYPGVNYCDGKGINGRYRTQATSATVIKFSNGTQSARIPLEYLEAAYLINMPCLKSHNESGISLTAKNHQGSILAAGTAVDNQSAGFMHPSLPANNPGTGRYRHLVDYMGHDKLGGNTLLFIIDAIWAGRSWEGWVEKWQMAPFLNDYPSSLFLSQDEVAIQSVCFDFLLEEYKNKPANIRFPYMSGADDFLMQAADPANWPAGIQYDPEGDGISLTSLGVYEHWNNPSDRQYSGNLSSEGQGIELIAVTLHGLIENDIHVSETEERLQCRIYPVPASGQVNIEYTTALHGHIVAEVFTASGLRVGVLTDGEVTPGDHRLKWQGDHLPAGNYFIRVQITGEQDEMIVKKFAVN